MRICKHDGYNKMRKNKNISQYVLQRITAATNKSQYVLQRNTAAQHEQTVAPCI